MLSPMAPTPELWAVQLGRLPYEEGLALQERVRAARSAQAIPDTLLLLEHDPVYTRGRRTEASELPFPEAWYAERGIAIVDVNRGGRATYHGPGQLTGYPIVRTDDVVAHVRAMERAIAAALLQEGVIAAGRPQDGPDFTGVWVDGERKIASIG
ncbi:MAG: lipoate-protein ligase B, partial [Actinobacteria bacterium]|nr:lipoate-protein ligase B [Actinomycetota bacterium]